MEDISQTLSALSSMIEINNRRAKVYQSLATKTHHGELRSLFSHYSEQSRQFSGTLSTWRSAYGGFAMPEGKGVRGLWAQLTSLLDHWRRKNVASTCAEMEQDAYKVYSTTMQMSFLPAPTASDIERQAKEFQKAHAKLKTLCEQAGNDKSIREELVRMPAF